MSITAICALCESSFQARTSYGLCPIHTSKDLLREFDRIESMRRQIQRSGLPDTLSLPEWLATISDFRNCCALCLKMPFNHIEMMVYEQGLTWENVFPCCSACGIHFHSSFHASVERVQVYLESGQDEDEESVGYGTPEQQFMDQLLAVEPWRYGNPQMTTGGEPA